MTGYFCPSMLNYCDSVSQYLGIIAVLYFPIMGTKKQQTAKGLLLKIGVFPISFMG